jgi:YegS/Rv2252/BmrU family lipid kinase
MLYFIVNEKSRSGKGAAVWKEIQQILSEEQIPYKAWITEYEGHAMKLAGEICEQEDDDICLIVLGGDGTANEVINGMTHMDRVRFGVIPTGSGNDLARGMGIKESHVQQLRRILDCMNQGTECAWSMDLGEVSWEKGQQTRKFAISAGVGLDAIVCKKALHSKLKDFLNKLHLGKLTYIALTVQSLFSMETTSAAVQFDHTGRQSMPQGICFAVMNFRAEGGGVPMAPKASATDGRLSVCSIYGIPKWRTFICLPFLVAAKHTWIRGFDVTDCGECRIRLSKPMTVHADGEYCGELNELTFRCLPEQLRVLR